MLGETDYRQQLSSTYTFISQHCCRLETEGHEASPLIRNHFLQVHHIKILMGEKTNIEALLPVGTVGLLRIFATILQEDPRTLQPSSTNADYIPPSYRFPHRSTVWTKIAKLLRRLRNHEFWTDDLIQTRWNPERDLLLREINHHHTYCLSRLLELRHLEEKFTTFRSANLILSNGNGLPAEIGPGVDDEDNGNGLPAEVRPRVDDEDNGNGLPAEIRPQAEAEGNANGPQAEILRLAAAAEDAANELQN